MALALRAVSLFFWAAAACPAMTAVAGTCPIPAGPVAVGAAQWNGWGGDIDNSRYQPEPAIRASDVSRLRFKWAYGYAGEAANDTPNDTPNGTRNGTLDGALDGAATDAGQPTVVDGRLFAASVTGSVYA